MILPRYNIPLPGSEARYVPLPGEDAVFGDMYGGSDAYVKFDILSTAEPQYHYLNLETSSRGWAAANTLLSELMLMIFGWVPWKDKTFVS